MARNLRGRRHLIRLWKEQDGLCAVCQQRITQWVWLFWNDASTLGFPVS